MAETASKRVNDTGDAGMNSILALLNTIAGQDTKTRQTADVGPLRDVMNQISASSGTQGQALLETIFQQLAGRVPQVMGNTFNATGSRAAPGRMAGTLQKIMADATISAQGQLAAQEQQRQQMLLQGAGTIANNNRMTMQEQRSGASGALQQAGKVLALAKTVKDVTGFDVAKKGKDLYKFLTTESSSPFTSSIPDVSSGNQVGMFGGTPGAPSVSGTTMSPGAGFSDMLNFFSIPGAETSPASASIIPADTFTMDSGTTGGTPGMSEADFSAMLAGTGGSGGLFTFGNASNTVPGNSLATFAAQPAGPAVNMSNPSASYTPSGSNSQDSLLNFSQGGSEKAVAAPKDTTLNDALTVYNASTYVTNPNKRKDIFDFSDGNFADDVGDVTDAAALVYPPLAAVRPFLNTTMATGESLDNFAHNPGQWFEDLFSGDEPITQAAWQTVTGAIDTVANLGQNVANFGNEVGDFFGDVFGW